MKIIRLKPLTHNGTNQSGLSIKYYKGSMWHLFWDLEQLLISVYSSQMIRLISFSHHQLCISPLTHHSPWPPFS